MIVLEKARLEAVAGVAEDWGRAWSGTRSQVRRIFEASAMPLAFVILPNLPLIVLMHTLTLLPHGYLNVECLVLGACSVFLPRVVVFVLLVAEMVGGFAYAICYSFQFTLGELLTSSRSLGDLPLDRRLEFAGAVALVVSVAAVAAFAVPRPRYRLRSAVCLLALVVLASAVDVLDGQNPYAPRDATLVSQRLTMSPWLVLGVRGHFFHGVDALAAQAQMEGMDSASAAAMAYVNRVAGGHGAVRPDVVLVVVESWGLLRDGQLAEGLTAAYRDPRVTAAYDVTEGTAPFDGLTVPGEARELCHSRMGFGILEITAAAKDKCLPAIFGARGYETYAVHGYVGEVFQRVQWYRALGFEQRWFSPDLERAGLPRCAGAFPGICDVAVAQWIGGKVLGEDAGRSKFVYWMTLNSHIPVPENPDLAADGTCAQEPALRNSTALCSWFRLVGAVHTSVAQLAVAAATGEKARPTVFVLVGDHAPPFAHAALRQEFSGTVVPWVMLTPKGRARLNGATKVAQQGASRGRTAAGR